MTTGENTGPETRTDLTQCDREPIHLLGHIQPFGCLIAVTADWLVAHASQNAEGFTGLPAEQIIGKPLVDIIRPEAVEALRDQLQVLTDNDRTERIGRIEIDGSGRLLDATLFVVNRHIIIELEPAASESEIEATLRQVRSSIAHLQRANTLNKLLDTGAQQVKTLTGFDRVMIYKFLPNGSGEVVAEARESSLEPFLGLRYPASDIPKQARALYVRTSFG